LPEYIISVVTVNAFKNRLDKFWSDQDMVYDRGLKLGQGRTRSETLHPLICLVYTTCSARPRIAGDNQLLSWTNFSTVCL